MQLEKTVSDLRSLKIQGSSQVRKAIVFAVKDFAKKDKSKNVKEFRKKLKLVMKKLLLARPTEPETRTALRIILRKANENLPLSELKKAVVRECIDFEKNRKFALEIIAYNALKLFKKNSVAFTHCHSHTVEEILALAFKKKKLKRVIATETRPKLQGRITVTNLTKRGIPCTLIVDSASATFLKEADIFFTGADALLADGSVVNKIGTALISDYAKKEKVPHYVASSSHCFDPLTFFGKKEVIEQRPVEEVWEKKFKKLSIANPAFDLTPAKNVSGIVSELGVHSPKSFSNFMVRKLHLKKGFTSLQDLLK